MKIEITNLKKVIKGATVLDDINYTFTGGRIYGLCGKNGCGKTMLMRLMAGLIYPSFGTIRIKDKVLGKDISFPESVGMLIENPSFLNEYTGKQNLEMLGSLQKNVDKEEVRRVLEQAWIRMIRENFTSIHLVCGSVLESRQRSWEVRN